MRRPEAQFIHSPKAHRAANSPKMARNAKYWTVYATAEAAEAAEAAATPSAARRAVLGGAGVGANPITSPTTSEVWGDNGRTTAFVQRRNILLAKLAVNFGEETRNMTPLGNSFTHGALALPERVRLAVVHAAPPLRQAAIVARGRHEHVLALLAVVSLIDR